MKKFAILLLTLITILVGCSSEKSSSKESDSSEKKYEVKVEEIDNSELMGRTGVTVGFTDAINIDEGKDHYTIMTRKKDDILWWIVGLNNGFVDQVEYLSKIQFEIANGDDGFNSSIKASGDYIAGQLGELTDIRKKGKQIKKVDKALETVERVEGVYDIYDAANEFVKTLPVYKDYSELEYELSEKTMSILINLVYFNYYPDVDFKEPKLYDKNGNVLAVSDETKDHHKWLISYDTKFRNFDNVKFPLEEDGIKRKEQLQLLAFDIYQLLKGKDTQTVYGEYATKAVEWYLKLEGSEQITTEEVLEMYYEAIENLESGHVSDKFRKEIAPLIERSKATMGEDGLPNELLPEVRLKSIEENMIWKKIEVLEFANESYKTGRTLRLKAMFNRKESEWYLDDIEIIEADDKPFYLTWEEVEKYASLKDMEIQKSDEQLDDLYYQFTVLNDNLSYVKGSVLRIDRKNGLISFVSVPEVVEDTAQNQDSDENQSIEEDQTAEESSESKAKPVKTSYSTLKDYEGKWQNGNGSYFLNIFSVSGNTADVSLNICSNNCNQIASAGDILTFSNNSAFYHYEDDGWGNSGDFTVKLLTNGIEITHNGEMLSLTPITLE